MLTWHRFHGKSWRPSSEILFSSQLGILIFKRGSNLKSERKHVNYKGVFWAPSFLDPNPNLNPPIKVLEVLMFMKVGLCGYALSLGARNLGSKHPFVDLTSKLKYQFLTLGWVMYWVGPLRFDRNMMPCLCHFIFFHTLYMNPSVNSLGLEFDSRSRRIQSHMILKFLWSWTLM